MAPAFGNTGGRHPLHRDRDAARVRDQRIFDAYAELKSQAKVAKQFGISKPRVQQILRRVTDGHREP